MLGESILDLVGNTPLVELNRINPHKNVKIYAKLEGFNPTGSVKDRIARNMLLEAEAEGRLKPGATLIEPTSGNTGIALAMCCLVRGYKLIAVMPENVSVERQDILRAFQAELVLTDGEKGTNGSIEVAKQIAEEHPEYVMLDQYSNAANPLAHYNGTAVEILSEVPKITHFVAGLGTGGTLMGCGKRLREANPDMKIVAVQPYPKSGLQGLRSLLDGYTPPILDMNQIDLNEFAIDERAFYYVQQLMKKEGIFGGISCGAVVDKALEIAETLDEGVIVTLFPDGGWKYLSERIWTMDPKELKDKIEGPLW